MSLNEILIRLRIAHETLLEAIREGNEHDKVWAKAHIQMLNELFHKGVIP